MMQVATKTRNEVLNHNSDLLSQLLLNIYISFTCNQHLIDEVYCPFKASRANTQDGSYHNYVVPQYKIFT